MSKKCSFLTADGGDSPSLAMVIVPIVVAVAVIVMITVAVIMIVPYLLWRHGKHGDYTTVTDHSKDYTQ